MTKRSVIVFGDLPIATKTVMFLQTLPDVEIGVVVGNEKPHNNDPWTDVPLLADYCAQQGLTRYTMDELTQKFGAGELTLGLSCRFSRIIKEELIDRFQNGIINTHGGLLPEFGGLYSANHTILQNSPIGGGTIHYIDAGIDTGRIIRRCEFPVTADDTAYTVFQKTQASLAEGLEAVIPEALEHRFEGIPHEEFVRRGYKACYYKKGTLEENRIVDPKTMTPEELERHVRAFDFPSYEPAYMLDSNGKKLYLRYHY